jgi:hypothetical protein
LVELKGDKRKESQKRRLSLQEVFGDEYPSIMTDLVKMYECVEDKEDHQEVEGVVDRAIARWAVPEDMDENDLRTALLSQLCRIAKPKNVLKPKQLELKGVDADSIRQQGFDKVWKKVAPVSSVLCFGSENIDLPTIRELLGVLKEIPSLDEIHDGIRKFEKRTGSRPTFHQSEWLSELNRSASAVDKILRRHFGSTLACEVRVVLGDFNDDLLQKTHDLIREYWARGIRIGNKFGNLPEIGISSYALNGRLNQHYSTTLAAEVERVLGPHVKPLTIPKVKKVIRKYQSNGLRLHRKFGRIPELDMSSYNLADRLKRNFSVSLTKLVKEACEESAKQN